MRKTDTTIVMSALAGLLVLPACSSVDRATVTGTGPGAHRSVYAALRPLDDQHAAEFRRAFEEARDQPRYIVALSPT